MRDNSELEPYTKRGGRRNQVADAGGCSCRSCSGRVIADCVAVCCCPCAVVNFFTLTFVKLPWMMGRKCISNMSKKKKRKKKLKNVEETDGISRKDIDDVNGGFGKVINGDEELELGGICSHNNNNNKYSARFEAERVWLELYRVDNLGFGRVSFNGIHSL